MQGRPTGENYVSFIVVLPIPFDVLDAAIGEMINYFPRGFIEYTRQPVTSASTTYFVQQRELGTIGELRLRKLLNDHAELYVDDPEKPKRRALTDEEKVYIQAQPDRDSHIKVLMETKKQIDHEVDDLHQRRIAHLHQLADGLLQRLESDPFTWPPKGNVVSLDECLEDFTAHVQSERRMSFWRTDAKGHKWVQRPEQHAKHILLTFLRGRLGNSALIIDEIGAGAGRIDIFIALSTDERVIVELKMCGHGYSSGYASDGIAQLRHYMENKDTHVGYLMIFDARMRDFGQNIPTDEETETTRIISKAIDVRPMVK